MSSNSFFKWMGLGQSGKPVAETDSIDEGERYFGLENFGNTCYSNSVIQALYFCKPFRECITNYPYPASLSSSSFSNSSLHSPKTPTFNSNNSTAPSASSSSNSASRLHNGINGSSSTTSSQPSVQSYRPSISSRNYYGSSSSVCGPVMSAAAHHEKDQNGDLCLSPGMEDTLFAALKDLFWKIATNRKKSGVLAPVNFINKVKKENELFRSSMHQDAHEFLNYLLNSIAEDVQRYQQKVAEKRRAANSVSGESVDAANGSAKSETSSMNTSTTWVHQLFEGVFSNETKCLTCETVTSRDESFMDLSIDVEMNSSITSCLRQFSASETLCHKNKYFCDVCCGLQEAERRMKIKKLPNILALHLKRFKYQEQLQKYIKLTYRVVFPFELRLFNTCDDTEDPDRMYELWACVIHIGSGPHHGHYVTIIKSNGQWLLFDDDVVTPLPEEEIQKYFGDLPGSGSGYVLFYQAVNLSMESLDIWNGLDIKEVAQSMYANGRPSAATEQSRYTPNGPGTPSPQVETPSKRLSDARKLVHPPAVSVPPSPSPIPSASTPTSTPAEEKKSRWGLKKKIKEKSLSRR